MENQEDMVQIFCLVMFTIYVLLVFMQKKSHREVMKDSIKFVEIIVPGNYALNKRIHDLVDATINSINVQSRMSKIKSHVTRVQTMKEYFPWVEFQRLLKPIRSRFIKSDIVSSLLIAKARLYKGSSNFGMALRCYNLALCFTPSSTSANASKIDSERLELLTLMEDDNLILPYSKEVGTNCVSESESETSMREVENKTIEIGDEHQENLGKEESRQNIFTVRGEKHKRIPSATNYIKINYNKEKGRHIIATKEIKPGTTVIVEDPYVLILNNAVLFEMNYCANCCMKVCRPTPCDSCVFVIYCSETCRDNDFKSGHKYECVCFPYLHAVRLAPTLHLGLKVICRAGPKILYELFKTSQKKVTRKCRKLTKGFDPKTGLYNSNSYYQIYKLISHIEKEDLSSLTWIAVSIIRILYLETNFFDIVAGHNDESWNFSEFVTAAFLQHCVSLKFNVFSLSDRDEEEISLRRNTGPLPLNSRVLLKNISKFQIITAIYALAPLINHSCYPTVNREHLPNGRLAIITNRSLKPGEELSLSYGYDFMSFEKFDRKYHLSKLYQFNCNCIPCTYDWPTLDKFVSSRQYSCPNCRPNVRDSNIYDMERCVLIHSKGTQQTQLMCRVCENYFDMEQIHENIECYEMLLMEADAEIKNKQPHEAIPPLIACVDFFQHRMYPPSIDLFVSQLMLQKGIEFTVNR